MLDITLVICDLRAASSASRIFLVFKNLSEKI